MTGYRGFPSRKAYEAHYSDPCNYADELPAMEAYAMEAAQEEKAMSEGKYLYRCNTCNVVFDTPEAKAQHKIDKHMPHRRLSAKERPKNRGDISCGFPGCEATFANEWNMRQHRRSVHNEGQPMPDGERR